MNGNTKSLFSEEEVENDLKSFRKIELHRDYSISRRQKLLDIIPRLFIFILGYASFFVLEGSWVYFGSLIAAIGTTSLMGSWFHDGLHHTKSERSTLLKIVMRIASAPLGISPLWWSYKHCFLHHRYVGQSMFDGDIQFGWLLRVTPEQKWHPTHRFQYIYIWFLYPFAAINMLKPGEIYQSKIMSKRTGKPCDFSVLNCMCDKYIPFIMIWLPVLMIRGASTFVSIFLVYELIAGIVISLITQVQHNTMATYDYTSIPIMYPIARQVLLSSDVGNKTGIWWWVSGGVSYHAVHHILPSKSFLECPDLSRRLDEVLANHGIKTPLHKSIVSAFLSHHKLLKLLADPNIAH